LLLTGGEVTMNVANAIPEDDLILARLVCSKLASIVKGIVSVGVATLELESPADFLVGKDKVVLGFLEVLRSVGVQPGHADKVELLRQHVKQLSELAVLFNRRFMELAQWRVMPAGYIRAAAGRLSAIYTDFFRALAAFSSLLGMDSDYSSKIQEGRRRVDEFLLTLDERHEPSATAINAGAQRRPDWPASEAAPGTSSGGDLEMR